MNHKSLHILFNGLTILRKMDYYRLFSQGTEERGLVVNLGWLYALLYIAGMLCILTSFQIYDCIVRMYTDACVLVDDGMWICPDGL